jgi:hypothetical protein
MYNYKDKEGGIENSREKMYFREKGKDMEWEGGMRERATKKRE